MKSQRERQPRFVRFTLSPDNFEALQSEAQARGLDGDEAAPRIILNEWIRRGRVAPAGAPLPPAPAVPETQLAPQSQDDEDDLFRFEDLG